MNRAEKETHRADNQIWNGAGKYGFSTEYRSFEPGGAASLYFNTIMGLTRRCYDFEQLSRLFAVLESKPDGDTHSELLWLGLERCVYLRCREKRPALDSLRQEYALDQLRQKSNSSNKLDRLKTGWFRRALGLPHEESSWETDVLNALEFDPGWDEATIQKQMEFLLSKYFGRLFRSELDYMAGSRVDLGFFAQFGRKGKAIRRISPSSPGDSGGIRLRGRMLFGWGQARADKLRTYIADCFGVSMLTPAELSQAEQACCTDYHRNCILHFTRGDYAPAPSESPERASILSQAEKNRQYYQSNRTKNQLEIQRLTQRLQNTILLLQEDDGIRSRSGRVKPALAWRAPAVGDEQIFDRPLPGGMEELMVDIFLDASASQNRHQEQLATQAYILTEALTRCRIPVRVMSYCSVSGCTVLRQYRDYRETKNNDRIFEYAAAGWNRDGLALRVLNWLLAKGKEQKRLVLILTDASPNDDQRLPIAGVLSRDYSGKPALQDTAAEAAALRKSGNRPLCLYSGREKDLSNAHAIYGRDVVRLPSIGWFADTVGKIIQGRLKELT